MSMSMIMLFLLYSVSTTSFDLIVSLPISSQNSSEFSLLRNNLSTEQPPITNVSVLEMTPDVNHALTIDHQNTVINLGQSLSMGITNAIVRPLTFFNNLIGSAAGSLPGLFAANGAALGTAIATPIQLGTLAANAAISGITGTVVSIPISLASGGAAQLVGLVGTGRQLWHNTLGSDPNNSTFWQNGELWLQPLAVVTGANSILAGVSLNALSQGVKNLGWSIERFGVSLSNSGQNAKQLGSMLIGWANGKPVYAPVINDTITNNNTATEAQQEPQLDHIINEIDFDNMITLNSSELIVQISNETTTTTSLETTTINVEIEKLNDQKQQQLNDSKTNETLSDLTTKQN